MTTARSWWLKRCQGSNEVHAYVASEGGAEDKGLVDMLTPADKKLDINVN